MDILFENYKIHKDYDKHIVDVFQYRKVNNLNWVQLCEELFSYVKKLKPNNKYQYIITFTIDPKLNEINDELIKKVENYILNLKPFRESNENTLRCDYVREGDGKEKHIHWHFSIISKVFIIKKVFNYYEKKFGFVQISKSSDKNYKNRLDYINKEKQSINLKGANLST